MFTGNQSESQSDLHLPTKEQHLAALAIGWGFIFAILVLIIV